MFHFAAIVGKPQGRFAGTAIAIYIKNQTPCETHSSRRMLSEDTDVAATGGKTTSKCSGYSFRQLHVDLGWQKNAQHAKATYCVIDSPLTTRPTGLWHAREAVKVKWAPLPESRRVVVWYRLMAMSPRHADAVAVPFEVCVVFALGDVTSGKPAPDTANQAHAEGVSNVGYSPGFFVAPGAV